MSARLKRALIATTNLFWSTFVKITNMTRTICRGLFTLVKGIIERDIEGKYPDLATPLVLYCGGGFRSALAADNLQKMGYTNVLSMDGGIRDWREKAFPLESSK